MAEWSNKLQDFIDEIATSVAIIERDWEGKIIVSACNEAFFQMTGTDRGHTPPSCVVRRNGAKVRVAGTSRKG